MGLFTPMRMLFHVPREFVKIYVPLTPTLHLCSPFPPGERKWIDTTQKPAVLQRSPEIQPIAIVYVPIVQACSVLTPRATLYCHGRAMRIYQLPKVLWEVHFFYTSFFLFAKKKADDFHTVIIDTRLMDIFGDSKMETDHDYLFNCKRLL